MTLHSDLLAALIFIVFGAVAVGIVIVAAVTLFVKGKLAEAGMKA